MAVHLTGSDCEGSDAADEADHDVECLQRGRTC